MRTIVPAVALLLLAGCSAAEKPTVHLTEHQRDSILATEKAIPGSATIGRALDLQGQAERRASGVGAKLDSLSN